MGDLSGSRVQLARGNLVALSSVRTSGRDCIEGPGRGILEADSGACTVGRIIGPERREIAGPHGRRHHSRGTWGLGLLIQLFVGTEEEGLVAPIIELRNDDRAAQRKSPLVQIQRCLFRCSGIEKIVRVKYCVLDVVVDHAVVVVRAGLAHHVDVYTEVGAILRRVVAALHLHFGDHVRAGAGRCNVAKVVHDGDTIKGELVLGLALACADEVHTGGIAGVVGLGSDDDVGRQGGNFKRVVTLDRQIFHLPGREGLS